MRRASEPRDPAARGPELREHIGQGYGGEPVLELWVEAPLGDEWVAAFRLLEDQGQMVIGELRVFPAEDDRPPGEIGGETTAARVRPAGRWRAEHEGSDAWAPEGGLTARLARSVRFDVSRPFAGEALVHVLGIYPDHEAWRRHLGTLALPDMPGGNRSRSTDVERVRVVAKYVAKVQEGSRKPVAELAAESNWSEGRLRQILAEARRRGWLTATPRRQAGGTLTEKALEILRRAEEANDA
jgi:hypothetical protein